MKVYLVDVGTLLDKDDAEFEQYSQVYNKKYGFWDEEQWFSASKNEVLTVAEKYVQDGGENSYAVVSEVEVPDSFDVEHGELKGMEYRQEDVIASYGKFYNKVVEDFLSKRKRVLKKVA